MAKNPGDIGCENNNTQKQTTDPQTNNANTTPSPTPNSKTLKPILNRIVPQRNGIRKWYNTCYLAGALQLIQDMDIRKTTKNQNTNALISQITKRTELTNEQKQHRLQQLTRKCRFEHNRTECHGETLTTQIPCRNPENEPYLTHIESTIRCAKCRRHRQNTDNGYIVQILNTDKTRTRSNKSPKSKHLESLEITNAANFAIAQATLTQQQ